jgi:hypothetical protein
VRGADAGAVATADVEAWASTAMAKGGVRKDEKIAAKTGQRKRGDIDLS